MVGALVYRELTHFANSTQDQVKPNQAFRELGRVVRTVFLLQYLSD
jgi:TnpA family transposase